MTRRIDLNDINIPDDYFTMDEIEKLVIVQELLDAVVEVIDNSLLNPHIKTQEVAKQLLQRTLAEHETNENYELCQVISDMLDLLNA